MELQTARLVLRPLRPGDLDGIHRYASDPEVVRHQPWGPNTPGESQEFLARMLARSPERDGHWGFGITLRDTGELIGSCHLQVGAERPFEAEIGYVLARVAWGRGLGTEAAGALLRLAFETLGLHRVWATCSPENPASARVLEKAGMTREGYLRQHLWQRDHWRDSLLYAAIEDDWRALSTTR